MSTERSAGLSVEIGGKKATVALINQQGRVLQRCHAKTLRGRPALATLEPYLHAIDGLLVWAERQGLVVNGIGITLPGSLDEESGRPLQIPSLPSLNGFPLRDFLCIRYRLPCLLYVDVEAAVLGEHRFGAGRDCRRVFFLTLNAVVGAALVVDGQIEREKHIGHICHLPVSSNGLRCSCGKRGCINTLISQDAVLRMVQRALRNGAESDLTRRLLGGEYFSLQILLEQVERGDSVALQIYCDLGRWLGMAVAKYVDLFDPHIFILGGESFYAHELLLTQVRRAITGPTSSRVCSMVEVVPARLGSDATLLGAAISLF